MPDTSQHPYLPNTPEQRQAMLRAIGASSAEELFADIPLQHRNPRLDLPPPLSEEELRREMEDLAAENAAPDQYACFLGGGAYRHFIPSVVRAVVSRGEFLTAYTPYQPEVSQGTLQATYEFQSMVCLLTGMEVANAGMYDGATALAEGALMACRVTSRYKVAVLDTVNPAYRRVLETYTRPQGIEVTVTSSRAPQVDGTTACLLAQYPNFLGAVEDVEALGRAAHAQGALLVLSAYPTALGLLKPPGELGADIATGECQPLGVPMSFGGPYVGFFACQERYLRQMPGRLVGRTVDTQGRTGYVLTVQTREQHIRRERATSNLCTSEALVALATTVYLAALGPQGLRRVAELCYHKAHYAASLIAELPGYSLPVPGAFFNEFVVGCPALPRAINRHLLRRGILGGLDVSGLVPNSMLFCVTEMNTRQEIEALVEALREAPSRVARPSQVARKTPATAGTTRGR
ncbi:MAG: aminomethyl-transferring glycine dehydrogenase subunit GcvPA [Chloroflexi bacterium]|nr:aminomethyl-transferring glycine dehydrogenase subunit GcvPA [Chloroflexota bacterium]